MTDYKVMFCEGIHVHELWPGYSVWVCEVLNVHVQVYLLYTCWNKDSPNWTRKHTQTNIHFSRQMTHNFNIGRFVRIDTYHHKMYFHTPHSCTHDISWMLLNGLDVLTGCRSRSWSRRGRILCGSIERNKSSAGLVQQLAASCRSCTCWKLWNSHAGKCFDIWTVKVGGNPKCKFQNQIMPVI